MTLFDSPQADSSHACCLYLIDGSAYIYRAFHAIRGLSNSKGMPTNAVYGFTRMLIKLMQERAPRYVAMFFDAKGPTFRHQMYDQYKATRPSLPPELAMQIPYIKKVTAGFNIPIIEIPGFEADDLIGTYARLAESAGWQVVMVTGDKDFMQLVTDHITIWDPMKDLSIDKASIARDFGLEPSQLIDMMGLCGDTSDNVPGVPGIGPKTALALIRQFGSMQALYDHIDEVGTARQREKLLAHRDQAFLSRRLVALDRQAPVAFELQRFEVQAPDPQALADLFQELEFRQLQQEYFRAAAPAQTRYHTVLESAQLEELAGRLAGSRCFALAAQTTSPSALSSELVGLSFAIEPHSAWYIPFGHRYVGAPPQLERQQVLARLRPILEDGAILKVGQDIKFHWTVLRRHNVEPAGLDFDTMLASYLLNPSKRAHNLDQIALDFLNHKSIALAEVAGKGKCALSFDQCVLNKAAPYACEEADLALQAYHFLRPQLEELGLMPLLEEVEIPLVPVLIEMEMTGVALDVELLRTLSKTWEYQLQRLEEEICGLAGERFNLHSSQQLGRILFEKLKLPCSKKTKKKTGYSTDVEVLTQLAEQHEMPALLLRHRSLAKLKSTYVDALLDQMDPQSGRIHTSFNQTITATGRLSSSDPNLQNIPIRSEEGREIRKAFIAPAGRQLLSADYSQIELRILAHYAEDPILIESFARDEDIHARTASEVFELPLDQVPAELRRQAKVINFGIIYGMSPFGLSRELGISPKMAQIYIDHYFRRYQGVRRYMEEIVAQARRSGRVGTLLGRLRLLPDINSSNPAVRQFAERTAINTPIQGTAADLIKVAMIRTAAGLREQGLRSRMLLSVHDEIIFEVPREELPTADRLIHTTMEKVWELKVPLKVNTSWGGNWAEAH